MYMYVHVLTLNTFPNTVKLDITLSVALVSMKDMEYIRMIPFCRSNWGGDQEMNISRSFVAAVKTLVGVPVGAAI